MNQMKRTRKLFAMMLVFALCFALMVPAMASDQESSTATVDPVPSAATRTDDSFSITISNSEEGHIYEAYQIFSGDLATENDGTNILSNITWGSGITEAGQAALLEKYDVTTVEALVEKLSALSDNSTGLDEFAKVTGEYLGTAAGTTENAESYVISNLTPGYYLVKDQDESIDEDADDAYTAYILEVVQSVEVTPKSDTPTVEKKVKDVDDSTANSQTDWQDSADYDIGDSVPFQLSATLGDSLQGYASYTLTFHDTMSDGLTFDADSVTVSLGDETLSDTLYVLTTTGLADGCTFEITLDVLAEDIAAEAGDTIVVEYTATLNDDAVIGGNGNPNTVKLEYSNNPNDEGTGKTPDDKVVVFTYEADFDKIVGGEEEKILLTGAGFSLYKLNAASTAEDPYEIVGEEITGETTFSFVGLDDGQYKLVETTTPAGYNTMTDVYFTISATHEVSAADPKLTALNVSVVDNAADITTDASNGTLKADIANYSGSTLPSTGGIGTTIFYVVGTILVLGAGIVLVTRKRMGHETK
jgi:fimbrial isopeptide formation D2 family protein/LPXTG-motif cell wall-anchored protein